MNLNERLRVVSNGFARAPQRANEVSNDAAGLASQSHSGGEAAAGMSHGRSGVILALACVAQFMVVLDVSIVNVALPSIRHDLGFSASGLQWVVNAYTLTFAGFLLLGGRAADLYGRRRIFLAGLALFSLASLAGGLAQNQGWLLAARATQGLGGAVLAPASLTLITTTFTEGSARNRAIGMWSALAGAGGATGAVLGGLLTDLATWRWILFVNVPIGALAIVAARIVLQESKDETRSRKLDAPGAVLATVSLTLLVFALVESSTSGWGSAEVLGSLGAAIGLGVLFLVQEAKLATAPLVPLRMLRTRSLASANVTMLCVGAAIFASWYFLSLYMQEVLGYSPLKAGIAFLPQSVAIIVGAQLSSRLVGRFGARILAIGGPLISAVGLAWLGRIGVHSTYWGALFVPSILVTFGVGLSFTPLAVAATSGVAHREAGLASALLNTARQVGGAIGLAALATIAVDRTHSLINVHAAAPSLTALSSGYGLAFTCAAGAAVLASVVGFTIPSHAPRRRQAEAPSPIGAPAETA